MKLVRPKFSTEQRRELLQLHVSDEQIAALENAALRVGVAVLRNEDRAPPLAAVDAEFKRLADALEAVRSALSDLEAAADDDPKQAARVQARGRIELASLNMGCGVGEDGLLDKLLLGISTAQAIVDRARADTPRRPTRRKTATPYPVKLIHDALLHGFAEARRAGKAAAEQFAPSAALKAPFRRVVQLCYEAMGRKNDDPDRAIKGYLQWRRSERNARRSEDVVSLAE